MKTKLISRTAALKVLDGNLKLARRMVKRMAKRGHMDLRWGWQCRACELMTIRDEIKALPIATR